MRHQLGCAFQRLAAAQIERMTSGRDSRARGRNDGERNCHPEHRMEIGSAGFWHAGIAVDFIVAPRSHSRLGNRVSGGGAKPQAKERRPREPGRQDENSWHTMLISMLDDGGQHSLFERGNFDLLLHAFGRYTTLAGGAARGQLSAATGAGVGCHVVFRRFGVAFHRDGGVATCTEMPSYLRDRHAARNQVLSSFRLPVGRSDPLVLALGTSH